MNYNLKNEKCSVFTQKLFSASPVPGGGGAAALVGALSVSLCAMAGNITREKEQYRQYSSEIAALLERAEELREEFLRLIDEDAAAFEPLSRAYALPKEIPENAEILKDASLHAASVPVKMMRCACSTVDILLEIKEKCSPLLLSDVACAAVLAKAALEAAAVNVFVNTAAFRGTEQADALELESRAMLEKYVPVSSKLSEDLINGLLQ